MIDHLLLTDVLIHLLRYNLIGLQQVWTYLWHLLDLWVVVHCNLSEMSLIRKLLLQSRYSILDFLFKRANQRIFLHFDLLISVWLQLRIQAFFTIVNSINTERDILHILVLLPSSFSCDNVGRLLNHSFHFSFLIRLHLFMFSHQGQCELTVADKFDICSNTCVFQICQV